MTRTRKLANGKRFSQLAIGSLLGIAMIGVGSATANRIDIGQFSAGNSSGWETKAFVGETDYRFQHEGNKTVLTAKAVGSASVLGKKIKIDLRKTPYVNWSWKVDRGLGVVNEKTKNGDDFAARLYVVKSGGPLIWRTKALNYVWSSSQARGERWPSPYQPDNSIMIATRGIDDGSGQWVTEKRNVREDLKAVFGKDITSIDGIAIMTDSDNTGKEAHASYGDIFFTAE